MKTDLYDAVTLEIEKAEILTAHLADRLFDQAEDGMSRRELYALSLIAQHLHEKHALIRDKALGLAKANIFTT